MRLSDAGLCHCKTKLIYLNHRPTPWLNEDAAPRSLEPIVRRHLRQLREVAIVVCDAKELDLDVLRPQLVGVIGDRGASTYVELMSSCCFDGKTKVDLGTDPIGSSERRADRGLDLGVGRRRIKPTKRNPHRWIPMLEFAPADELGVAKDLEATRRVHVSPNEEVERRGNAPMSNEADLSRSSIPPWPIEAASTRDRSNRLLGGTPTFNEA